MSRYKFIFAFIIAFAILFTVQTKTALADPATDYPTLEVPECAAFRFVLEDNDQLYLCRTVGIEDTATLPADVLGAAGLALRIEDAGGTIRLGTVPTIDFGISIFYFAAADVDIPTWADAAIRIVLMENPALFTVPDESTLNTPVFSTAMTLDDTRDAITERLPRQMLRLQEDDPTVGLDDLVVGTGITPQGKTLYTSAFPPLVTIAPAAFLVSGTNAGGSFVGGTQPSFVSTIVTAGRTSRFTQGLEKIGSDVGLPFTATMLILGLLFIGLIGWAIFKINGELSTIVYWIQPIVLLLGILGTPLFFESSIVIAGFAFVFGSGMYINRHWPS